MSFIPAGYHAVTPYLVINDVEKVIEFLKSTFDAVEKEMHRTPEGAIQHAEVRIGDSAIMMGQARGEWKAMPGMLYVYVPDADATYKRALAAGATSLREPIDQSYGDRSAAVIDVAGNQWWIATHFKEVS